MKCTSRRLLPSPATFGRSSSRFEVLVFGTCAGSGIDEAPAGFSFIDAACGDTQLQRQGHFGVFPAGSYLGIDLSEQALRIAERELTGLNCSVELVEADFVLFMETWSGPADVVWIGQSLHHLVGDAKRRFIVRGCEL